jgi:hypothetical protein
MGGVMSLVAAPAENSSALDRGALSEIALIRKKKKSFIVTMKLSFTNDCNFGGSVIQ